MKKTKIISLVVFLVLLAGLISACAQTKENSTSSGDSSTASSGKGAAAPALPLGAKGCPSGCQHCTSDGRCTTSVK
ncbi:hypothetical protein HZA98_03435 [Candidatus Woesearchaeota archaeon]|nr:hypothetical protein [Candidatus Woesearchaeota archaeon]